MLAELFGAIFAGYRIVAALHESFGIHAVRQFPLEENDEGYSEKRPGERVRNEYKGREHHSVVPVIYSARSATLVLHYPGLEGAEEQDADNVAYRVSESDQKKNSLIEYTHIVKHTDYSVECYPRAECGECYNAGLSVHFRALLGSIRLFLIIALELFLAAHTLYFRGEKSEDHTDNEVRPDASDDQSIIVLKSGKGLACAVYSVVYVDAGGGKKYYRSYSELKIVHSHGWRQGDSFFIIFHTVCPFAKQLE